MTRDALPLGLDVGLVAYDGEAMVAFYQDGLGMPLLDATELPAGLLTRFAAGPSVIKINQQAQARAERAPGDLTQSRGFKLLTLMVQDLAETSRNLQTAGFPALNVQDYGGLAVAFTTDPNNSMVELLADPCIETPTLRAVGLTVGDLQASRTFLTQVLGFSEGKTEPIPGLNTDKVEFAAGTITLKLWQINDLPSHTGPIHNYAGIRYLTVRVDDMVSILSRAQKSGCNVPQAPTQFSPGLHIAMVEDPDGNWFELAMIERDRSS